MKSFCSFTCKFDGIIYYVFLFSYYFLYFLNKGGIKFFITFSTQLSHQWYQICPNLAYFERDMAVVWSTLKCASVILRTHKQKALQKTPAHLSTHNTRHTDILYYFICNPWLNVMTSKERLGALELCEWGVALALATHRSTAVEYFPIHIVQAQWEEQKRAGNKIYLVPSCRVIPGL